MVRLAQWIQVHIELPETSSANGAERSDAGDIPFRAIFNKFDGLEARTRLAPTLKLSRQTGLRWRSLPGTYNMLWRAALLLDGNRELYLKSGEPGRTSFVQALQIRLKFTEDDARKIGVVLFDESIGIGILTVLLGSDKVETIEPLLFAYWDSKPAASPPSSKPAADDHPFRFDPALYKLNSPISRHLFRQAA
jgi:hypothetical protein